MWREMTFGSNFGLSLAYNESVKNIVTKFLFLLYELLGPQQFTWSVDSKCRNCILQRISGVINSPQFMSPFPWALPLPTNLCWFDRWNPAWGDSGLSLQETLHLTVLNSILTDVLARWGNVAVAPIMNVVFHLSISAALVLLASHRQETSQQQSARWKHVIAVLFSSRLCVKFP